MSLKFVPEIFEGLIVGEDRNLIMSSLGPESLGRRTYELIASASQAAFHEWLSEQPVVYALKDSYSWHIAIPRNLQGESLATHSARLVDIRELKK